MIRTIVPAGAHAQAPAQLDALLATKASLERCVAMARGGGIDPVSRTFSPMALEPAFLDDAQERLQELDQVLQLLRVA